MERMCRDRWVRRRKSSSGAHSRCKSTVAWSSGPRAFHAKHRVKRGECRVGGVLTCGSRRGAIRNSLLCAPSCPSCMVQPRVPQSLKAGLCKILYFPGSSRIHRRQPSCTAGSARRGYPNPRLSGDAQLEGICTSKRMRWCSSLFETTCPTSHFLAIRTFTFACRGAIQWGNASRRLVGERSDATQRVNHLLWRPRRLRQRNTHLSTTV